MDRSTLIHAVHHTGSGILDLLLHEHHGFIEIAKPGFRSLLLFPAAFLCPGDAGIILLILPDLLLFFLQGSPNGFDTGADMFRIHLFGIDLLF